MSGDKMPHIRPGDIYSITKNKVLLVAGVAFGIGSLIMVGSQCGDDLRQPVIHAKATTTTTGLEINIAEMMGTLPTTPTTLMEIPPSTAAPEVTTTVAPAPPASAPRTAKSTTPTTRRTTPTTRQAAPAPTTTLITAAPPSTASTAPSTTMPSTTTTTLSPAQINRNFDIAVEYQAAQILDSIKRQPQSKTVDVCPITDIKRLSDGAHFVITGYFPLEVPSKDGNVLYRIAWTNDSSMKSIAVREKQVEGTDYIITHPPGDGRGRFENPDQVCGLRSVPVEYSPLNRVNALVPGIEPQPVGIAVRP
jgi:hypothetical protein